MKLLRLLVVLLVVLVVLLSASVLVTKADCVPIGTAGDDNIVCDNLPVQPAGSVLGLDGNDTIIVDASVNAFIPISGGNVSAAAENGNDTIINDGSVGAISGDSWNGVGGGSDIIVNNNNVGGSIVGDSASNNGTGDDIIVNNGTIGFHIYGDTDVASVASGNDTIINNGTVTNINGDAQNSVSTGSDTITNNGSASYIFGDSILGSGTGNDIVTNNGSVSGDIYGDTQIATVASGNDTITNHGTVTNIYSDDQAGNGTGSDNITNSGSVSGDIIVGGGNDIVTIEGSNATVGGTMDGGAGTDVLTFSFSSSDPAQREAWLAEIAAANPNGGTLTLNGHVYTWTNFESLTLLLNYLPINPNSALQTFCALAGGVDIYISVGDEGVFSLYVSAEAISNALAYAQLNNIDVTIDASDTSQLWALTSEELQVRDAQGAVILTFLYQSYCGELPEGDAQAYVVEVPEQEEELPAYTIINQPYGG